ncbi:hypothetical protein NDU88_001893 [Pleurodeles waltl]|uniref:Uncharacterized protein n=1 Tax=Pleurodeles waltl TaxID=8319 RepID=A0AAV7REA7_PLEWA|nr:hypothetical protein NDU88_001893 [Pleurodeles waltl]
MGFRGTPFLRDEREGARCLSEDAAGSRRLQKRFPAANGIPCRVFRECPGRTLKVSLLSLSVPGACQ